MKQEGDVSYIAIQRWDRKVIVEIFGREADNVINDHVESAVRAAKRNPDMLYKNLDILRLEYPSKLYDYYLVLDGKVAWKIGGDVEEGG